MAEMEERIASLSPRQLEIMRYVAQRLSSKEIGAILGLSPATVDSHIAAALQRMQLSSRRDAALWLVRLRHLTDQPDPGESSGERSRGGHHGGDQPPQSPPFPRSRYADIWYALWNGGRDGPFKTKTDGQRAGRAGMARAVGRFLLDGFYIILIFGIMSGVAFGAHWVVIQCEQQHIDPVVLWILRVVSYLLAALDGIGVVCATGFLTFRFIRAIVRADD